MSAYPSAQPMRSSAAMPNSVEAAQPMATSESMLGERRNSAGKPPRKNLKFTKSTGTSKKNSTSAVTIMCACPVKASGSGQPNM